MLASPTSEPHAPPLAALTGNRRLASGLPAHPHPARNSRQGVARFTNALRQRHKLAKSRTTPGLRARVRREGPGDLRYRWYEPGNGRYSEADPLGLQGDSHPFSYVRSRPTHYIDPLGLVTRRSECGCCNPELTAKELNAAANYLFRNWHEYMWNPAHAARGGSCLDSAEKLLDDIENDLAPSCWITSVQLIKKPGADAFRAVCGFYFPVHYVVKLVPCNGRGPDWMLDAYTLPRSHALPRDQQIEQP